jgi:imidazole glycerol phosphate synthase subunit HisF
MARNKREESFTIEPRGNDFVVVRIDASGKRSRMALSEDNILTLAQSALRLRDHILAKRSRSGVVAEAMTPVSQIEMQVDLHGSEIFLTMIDRHGARVGFSLPPAVAQPLAERLPVRLAEILRARPTSH